MLTIQPNLTTAHSKMPSFGRYPYEAEYVDYEEVSSDTPIGRVNRSADEFDIDYEKEKTAKEYGLWQQTKDNLDSLAQTTESVPVLKTGTKFLSSLISIAIGWGGLRWGTVGTLEVCSKIGKTDAARYVSRLFKDGKDLLKIQYKGVKDYMSGTSWVKSLRRQISDSKDWMLDTSAGRKYTQWKDAIKATDTYQSTAEFAQNTKAKFVHLNPKRVFVETMGVAGGGTAAVNTLGGKTIDGTRYNVEQDEDGTFYIDNPRHRGYRNAS